MYNIMFYIIHNELSAVVFIKELMDNCTDMDYLKKNNNR